MSRYLEFIKRSALLGAIPGEQVRSCLKDGRFRVRAYGRNNVVHFSGDVCGKLEVILSGKVAVQRIDESGSLMSVAEFYGDEVLGGNLLFSKAPYYPLTITAKEPTVILAMDRECLLALFSLHPDFLRSYLAFVSDHTAILGERIRRYGNRTIRECLLEYLEEERQRQGANPIQLPMSKKALAERMGVQRTSLSRELAKMREDGLIRYEARSIQLL